MRWRGRRKLVRPAGQPYAANRPFGQHSMRVRRSPASMSGSSRPGLRLGSRPPAARVQRANGSWKGSDLAPRRLQLGACMSNRFGLRAARAVARATLRSSCTMALRSSSCRSPTRRPAPRLARDLERDTAHGVEGPARAASGRRGSGSARSGPARRARPATVPPAGRARAAAPFDLGCADPTAARLQTSAGRRRIQQTAHHVPAPPSTGPDRAAWWAMRHHFGAARRKAQPANCWVSKGTVREWPQRHARVRRLARRAAAHAHRMFGRGEELLPVALR